MEYTRTHGRVKRSKPEQMNTSIANYLHKRNYPDERVPTEITAGQMEMKMLVAREVSKSKAISFTCYNTDLVSVSNTFSKFVSWIKELQVRHPSSGYQELEYLIGPLYCHIYIDFLERKDKDVANSFFKLHHSNVEQCTTEKFVIKLVNAIISDSSDCPELFQTFKSNKYQVNLSSACVTVLRDYLAENKHLILLEALQLWFNLNEVILDDMDTTTHIEQQHLNSCSSLKNIQDAITAVNNGTPPIYVIKISNDADEINCGLINRTLGIAVYSYNSKIFLTSLAKTKELGDVSLTLHSDRIYDFCFMNKRKWMMSASQDTTLRLLDLNSYDLLNTYKGHDYPVYKVTSSPNDCYFVSGSYDRTCRLWSTENNNSLRVYVGHTQEITSLDFHPNSIYFASGSADKNIRMWTLQDCMPVRLLLGSVGVIYTVKYSMNGKYLASSGEDKMLRIWDLLAGKQLTEVKTGDDPIVKIVWNSNDTVICTGSLNGMLKMWNVGGIISNQDENPLHLYNLNKKLLSIEFAFDTFSCLIGEI